MREFLTDLTWSDSRTWWILVCAGLAVLALSTAILARMRWIQSRPFMTCVILSVFAHVLLVATAYLSNVFDLPPPPVGDDLIYLSMIEPEENSVPREDDPEEPKPWEQLSATAVAPPELQPLERSAADLDIEPQRVVDPLPEISTAPPLLEPQEPPLAVDSTEAVESVNVVESVGAPPLDDLAQSLPEPNAIAPLPIEATEPLDTAAMAATPPVAPVTEAQAEDTNTQTFQEVPRVDKGDIAAAAEDNLPSTQAQAASSAGTADGDLERVARVDTDRQQRPEELIRDGKWYDGRPAPKTYQLRTSSQRAEIARRRGATAETEAAVTEALQWLSSVQSQDGGWDASAYGAGQPTYVDGQLRDDAGRQADMGISGLAILAFLGNGQTHLSGAHRQTVQRGLEYLLRNQGTDGNMSGGAGNFARMYCHGIATLAIGEAYAMTGDPRLKEFIIRAANHTIRSQNVYSGGWRYWPGESGDTSQFGWQVMALMSAQSAGIDIPESTRTLMNRFLQSVTMGQHGGLAAYRPSEAPKRSMTAEAMVCRMFLQGATVPKYQLAEGSRHLLEELPGPGRPNLYYWYYATLALAQRNDRDWQRWNEALQQQLLPRQRHDGQWQGSWDPDTMYGGHGGRIYSTAMATLCLEVYYRYLPIFPDGD